MLLVLLDRVGQDAWRYLVHKVQEGLKSGGNLSTASGDRVTGES
jgi:hypothetical protein